MSNIKKLLRSFARGEVTPQVFARVDLDQFQTGLATCRNFICRPHGVVDNRPGTQFVAKTKNAAVVSRLIPFSFNNQQTFAVEIGEGYFRFYTNGATLLVGTVAAYNGGTAYVPGNLVTNGGVTYYCIANTTGNAPPNATYWYAQPASGQLEVPNPYVAADIFDIHYVQSNDTFTLTHPNYNPAELQRLGAADWIFTPIIFNSTIVAPTGLSVTPTPGGVTTTSYGYVVTTINAGDLQESVQSGQVVTCTNDLTIAAHFNTISWSAVAGAVQYNVYKLANGIYGLIGSAGGTEFIDNNITPDISNTPPFVDAPFSPGAINGALPTANGSGYAQSTTTVSITTSTGSGGSILPNVDASGAVSSYTILNPGINYAPTDTFAVVGAGTGATGAMTTGPATGVYPSDTSYFQQRKYFADTLNKPQNFWATRSATEANMNFSIPSRADDRLSFRIAARDANAIRHFVPLNSLIMLTASGEWLISSVDGSAITPSNILVTPQSYIGSSNVTPAIVNKGILYAAARGGRMRELIYNYYAGGYISNDVSKLAPHLFDYMNIGDIAYQKAPYPNAWCVSSNGNLLGMSYQPEDQIAGWHRHDTLYGTFESVCAISENNEDILYAVVNRTLNGVQSRFIERMASRNNSGNNALSYFVDCGATYNGAPATVISGLTWLEGVTVNILADGGVEPQQVVTGGTITLSNAASVVTVGIPIIADLQTLPFSLDNIEASARGAVKDVNKVWLRVDQSSGIYMGPDFDDLRPMAIRSTEPWGEPPILQSGELDPMMIEANWTSDGQVCVRQSDPLPLTIVSMTYEVAFGG